MKRLHTSFALFIGIMILFCACQKEEQVQQQLQKTSQNTTSKKSVNEAERLKYDDVVASFRKSGATEISIEESGLDLKSISFERYISYSLFETKTGTFLILGYEPNSMELKKAEEECKENYIDYGGFKDCRDSGSHCRWEVITDKDGNITGAKIIICDK